MHPFGEIKIFIPNGGVMNREPAPPSHPDDGRRHFSG